ncbi:hypothetical protein [Microbacterium sp. HJ5]
MTCRRWNCILPVVIGLATVLSGCVAVPPTSSTCVDWVWFDTPDAAAADADRVAIGTVDRLAGTRERYGETANVWRVSVSEWIVGNGEKAIEVVSSPRTCESGSPYPYGDPLDTDGEVMLFLRDSGQGVADTITGLQGVIPAPESREIPADWPDTQ